MIQHKFVNKSLIMYFLIGLKATFFSFTTVGRKIANNYDYRVKIYFIPDTIINSIYRTGSGQRDLN